MTYIRNLTNYQILLLNALFRSERGLDATTFMARYRMLPSEVFEAMNKLMKAEIVQREDVRFSLTSYGFDWCLKNRHLFEWNNKEWREVPAELKQTAIAPFEPYIPRRSELHARLRRKTGQAANLPVKSKRGAGDG